MLAQLVLYGVVTMPTFCRFHQSKQIHCWTTRMQCLAEQTGFGVFGAVEMNSVSTQKGPLFALSIRQQHTKAKKCHDCPLCWNRSKKATCKNTSSISPMRSAGITVYTWPSTLTKQPSVSRPPAERPTQAKLQCNEQQRPSPLPSQGQDSMLQQQLAEEKQQRRRHRQQERQQQEQQQRQRELLEQEQQEHERQQLAKEKQQRRRHRQQQRQQQQQQQRQRELLEQEQQEHERQQLAKEKQQRRRHKQQEGQQQLEQQQEQQLEQQQEQQGRALLPQHVPLEVALPAEMPAEDEEDTTGCWAPGWGSKQDEAMAIARISALQSANTAPEEALSQLKRDAALEQMKASCEQAGLPAATCLTAEQAELIASIQTKHVQAKQFNDQQLHAALEQNEHLTAQVNAQQATMENLRSEVAEEAGLKQYFERMLHAASNRVSELEEQKLRLAVSMHTEALQDIQDVATAQGLMDMQRSTDTQAQKTSCALVSGQICFTS